MGFSCWVSPFNSNLIRSRLRKAWNLILIYVPVVGRRSVGSGKMSLTFKGMEEEEEGLPIISRRCSQSGKHNRQQQHCCGLKSDSFWGFLWATWRLGAFPWKKLWVVDQKSIISLESSLLQFSVVTHCGLDWDFNALFITFLCYYSSSCSSTQEQQQHNRPIGLLFPLNERGRDALIDQCASGILYLLLLLLETLRHSVHQKKRRSFRKNPFKAGSAME